jgi:DNA polymerase
MFVGAAPTDEAGRKGRPFVGATGNVLDDWLSFVGLRRDVVYLTNVVKCVVPRVRDGFRQSVLDPRHQEVEACRDWLNLEIEVVRPKLIITLGVPALRSFFPGESVASFRTKGRWREKGNLVHFALYHPAAWARWSDRLRAEEERTFAELRQLLEKLNANKG